LGEHGGEILWRFFKEGEREHGVRSCGDLVLLHQVSQMYMVAPLDLQFAILYDVLKKHVSEDADYKVSHLSM
jgi:hypothetical protein